MAEQAEQGEEQSREELEAMTFPPIGEEPESQQEEEGGEKTPDELSELRERLERFEAKEREFSERERRMQETIDKLLTSQQAQQRPAQSSGPEQISFNDLPDPVDKPDEFKRTLGERMQRMLASQQQAQTQQQTRQQRLDAVWNQFQSKYPELSKREALVNGVAALEANQLRSRGLDPQEALLADPDGFMDRIARKMRQELGESEEGSDMSGQQEQQRQANRTAGVSGGSQPRGGGKGAQKSPGFIEQLKRAQQDSGLI